MADLELAVMMNYVTAFVTAVSFIVHYFGILPQYFNAPTLSFYLTLSFLLVFIYHLVRMATIGGFAIYENRLSVIISILTGIILFVLLIPGRGIISINFGRAFSLQLYHATSILNEVNPNFESITLDSFLITFILLFCVFIYSFVPVILKYGNSYIGMMKETYKLEAQVQKEEMEREALKATNQEENGNQVQEREDETLNQLKETRRVLKWFNLGFVFHLLVIFCWVKPITDAWNSYLNDEGFGLELLRITFTALHIFTLLFTYKSEISRYMLRVYDSIASLLSDPSPENLRGVRHRADAHINYMGVMSYQVMMKIIIPFLLLLLFVNKKVSTISQSQELTNAYSDINNVSYIDWNCLGTRDPLEIFRQQDTCPTDKSQEIISIENGLGILSPLSQDQSDPHLAIGKEILRKLQKYGFIHNEFWNMFFSLWIFLYYLATYILTIIYIFYRKTIEQV